jgi:hypothetical protein
MTTESSQVSPESKRGPYKRRVLSACWNCAKVGHHDMVPCGACGHMACINPPCVGTSVDGMRFECRSCIDFREVHQ